MNFDQLGDLWRGFCAEFNRILDNGGAAHLWVEAQELRRALKRVDDMLERDINTAASGYLHILHQNADIAEISLRTVNFITQYLDDGAAAPSMPALCLAALAYLPEGLHSDNLLLYPVLSAAVLAEIPNNLPYHNNAHFRKVLLHAVRLAVAHNRIFANTRGVFTPQQISQILTAACGHDIGHDAQGNIIDRKYNFALCEQKSFGYLAPFLNAFGYAPNMAENIKIMVMTTDVSPFGDPASPAYQLREAYNYHYGGGEDETPEDQENMFADADNPPMLAPPLRRLAEDDRLCLMAMILHEADIMNSAGLDYNVTIEESRRIGREIGKISTSPEDTYLFLKVVCQGRMVTEAAQFLGQENLEAIYERVRADIRAGKTAYA